MRVLVLSFYFEPDLSAGSFRATALVRALAHRMGEGSAVDVVTTQPNRYQSYQADTSMIKVLEDGVHVFRIALPAHRSGFLDQARAFFTYAVQALWLLRGKKYDVVFATSSRLMTSVLGAVVSRWKNAPLYLDVRDIFVDTVREVLPKPLARAFEPVFRVLECYAMSRASHINLVSEGFRDYFERYYPDKKYSFVPNGIDEDFLDKDFSVSARNTERVVVLYAGNIGEGQGLHRILPGLATAFHDTHEFWIVGDGGLRGKLARAVEGMGNVRIMSPVARSALIELYRQSDILFIHLNDYAAFKKVLPSKVFEYAATGKPILAGVAGFAADFIAQIPNAAVFPPCDSSAGAKALISLDRSSTDLRQAFIERYKRTRLMDGLAQDVLAVARI